MKTLWARGTARAHARHSLDTGRRKLLFLFQMGGVIRIYVIDQVQTHEQTSMMTDIRNSTVNKVTTKHHHASGGDGDLDGVRQNCIELFTGKTVMANYLKRTQATSEDGCIFAATVDDDGVWDGLTPELSVGVVYLRLKVTMKSLVGEGASRD